MPLMHIWLTLILILVDFIPFFSILFKKKEKRQRELHNWRKWIDEARKQLVQDSLIVLDLYFPWYYSRSCEYSLEHFMKIASTVQVDDWIPFLHHAYANHEPEDPNRQLPAPKAPLVYLEPPCAWWFSSSCNKSLAYIAMQLQADGQIMHGLDQQLVMHECEIDAGCIQYWFY
jgi:hypothetical protein